MKKTTQLRWIGVVIFTVILWLVAISYNIGGISVLLLAFGFAVGYEYLIVRTAK